MMKRKALKFFSLIFVLTVLFSTSIIFISAESSFTDDYSDYAEAIYLYNCSFKKELYCVGENKSLAVGPTAKIMTGLIACEMFKNDLDRAVPVSKEMLQDISGNVMGLKAGMTVTVKDLLYGTICGGNNDAAQVLAITACGSVASFVDQMNLYARKLYMKNTQYSNPTGLDDLPSRTTLQDTLKLALAASKNSLYTEISSTSMYKLSVDGMTVYNRNALISQFSAQGYINKSAKGLIAGSTESGGYSLATFVSKGDMNYICIVMGAEADANEIYSYFIANSLLNSIPRKYSIKKIVSANETLGKLDVDLAITDKNGATVPYTIPEDIHAYLPNDADFSKISYKSYFHNKKLAAPIEKGTCIGGIDVYYGDELVASSPLVAKKSVEKNYILSALSGMKRFFGGRFFIIFIVIFVPSLVFYIYVVSIQSRRKKVSTIKYKRFY